MAAIESNNATMNPSLLCRKTRSSASKVLSWVASFRKTQAKDAHHSGASRDGAPAATWIALDRRVPPTVTVIESESWSNSVWVSSDSAPAVALVRRGDALVLRGHFPVARAADLRVRLRGPRGDLNLRPTDFGGSVRVGIPLRAASGDWRLVVETRDGRTPAQEIITIRVM